MDNIIVKIVSISIIVFMIISSFRIFDNSLATTKISVEKNGYIAKISKEEILKINDESKLLKGGDVIAAIRYYADQPDVTIRVTVGGVTRSYTTTLYTSSDFSIPELSFYEAHFEFFRSTDQKTIYFTKE